jgi:hypothetical protein
MRRIALAVPFACIWAILATTLTLTLAQSNPVSFTSEMGLPLVVSPAQRGLFLAQPGTRASKRGARQKVALQTSGLNFASG